ncbi:MAG: isopentenyl-diphosphate Delta-isomerase [Candidatus Gottesmanbacteria bacterium]
MEKVVLVDDKNREIGTADKATVHTKNTPLHRGFSFFLFNSRNELLLTQRAFSKKTFPGVWSNTICGHPMPGESIGEAVRRRLESELNVRFTGEIKEASPYRYRFKDKSGIVENEICPIFIAYVDYEDDNNFTPNPEEVADWQWIPWIELIENIKMDPTQYSPWSVQEARILEKIL